MDVSIVIVNWNTCDILRKCLLSIYKETQTIDYEVVVVDNASSDCSAAMVKTEFPNVVLIENSSNRGFAAANNQGLTVAMGRYVLFLNSDAVILDNAIAKTMIFADSHPDAAVIGCRVLNQDHTLQKTCFMFPSVLNMVLSALYLYKLFPRNHFWGREQMTWWDRNSDMDVDVVTGCFMLVRRKALEKVGSMDEQFFIYGEETDICYRFKKNGWRILFTPCAEIVHLGGASSKQVRPAMTLQLRGSILLFIKKHRGRLVYVFACMLVSLFFLIRVPYWLTLAFVSANNKSNSVERANTYAIGALKSLRGARKLCKNVD